METIVAKNKKFVVESVLATHEDHVSYICVYSGVHYMVRVYKTGYEEVLANYKRLKKAGINMAKICYHDDEAHVIVFDHFPEQSVLENLASGDLPEHYFKALFECYRFAKYAKIALDWKPQNFMLRGSQMFYLPIKVSDLTEDNKLEKTGLRYWFRGAECVSELKRKGLVGDDVTPLPEEVVNKNMVLMAVKYW